MQLLPEMSIPLNIASIWIHLSEYFLKISQNHTLRGWNKALNMIKIRRHTEYTITFFLYSSNRSRKKISSMTKAETLNDKINIS
jgi:hypothetical protein